MFTFAYELYELDAMATPTYDQFVQELAGRGLGVVAHTTDGPDSAGTLDLFSFDHLLQEHDGGVAAASDDGVDEQVNDDGVLTLDLGPHTADFIDGQHGQDASDGGQTLQVVLVGIGLGLQVDGNVLESSHDALDQSRRGHGRLEPWAGQFRVGTGKKYKKKRNKLNIA